jgi:5-methylcytosine-specific restriction endonuclease McrA
VPSDIEIDHVVPLSKGGSNDLSNLVTACKPCNQAKRGKAAHKVKGCDAQGNPHGRDDW